MSSFELTCQNAELAAKSVESAAKQLQRLAKAMAKAAAEGNPARIRQAVGQIGDSIDALGPLKQSVSDAWPYSDDDMAAYLDADFVDDLIAAASAADILLTRLDDRLAAFPVIVQVLPRQSAVRVDAQRLASLRPSVVAECIRRRMKKSPVKPEQFIELLYKAYRLVARDSQRDSGAVLLHVYDALTLHPDARRAYDKAEFFRDVYLLDESNVRETKSGARLTIPGASTGSREASRTIVVVTPEGKPRYYYGVRFEEAT